MIEKSKGLKETHMNIKQTYKVDSDRRGLLRALPAVGLWGLTPGVWAQGAYPNRPLKVIVPQPAGGGFDFVARALARRATGMQLESPGVRP
jgi:hypothetical protein